MSTLNGPIWSRCSIALTCPPGQISSTHKARKYGARTGMNINAHQEKKNHKEKKTSKRREKEKTGDRF